MTAARDLPYAECGRRQAEGDTTPWPAFALPPFHPSFHPGVREAPGAAAPRPAPRSDTRPAPRPMRRPRRRRADGAAVSGFLAALCVGALLTAIALAAVRTRC
ncbi:hypothetical protein [Streptomyces sp. NPDC048521]|uniref:hypothetical protein n=1 Tax=Streptomyces sp. NPDC048521 TaxID=3365566 RepID=UPI00371DEF89